MAIEFAFGDLYARDGLDLRSREIVAIAALAVSSAMRDRNCGSTSRPRCELPESRKPEIVEILMQTARLRAAFRRR